MSSKRPFNPTEAQWAQIRSTPGRVQHVNGMGPVVYLGDVTPERAKQLAAFLPEMHKHVGPETSLKALKKKRPMIERCYIFTVEGRPMPVGEVSHTEFREWAIDWFKRHGVTEIEWGYPDTSPQERENVLREMVKRGISPSMQLT